MEHQVIPGYFYDAVKKRYFKIEQHDIPAFVTQRTVNSHTASEQCVKRVQQLNRLIEPPTFKNLLPLISIYERINCSLDGRFVHDYGRSQMYHFRHQSTMNIEPMSHCLLSPTGSHLHGSCHSLFTSYRLFCSRITDDSADRRQRQKRKTRECRVTPLARMCVQQGPTTSCSGYLVLDLIWRRPGREMMALCDVLGELSLVSVELQDTPSGYHHLFNPTRSMRLPRGGSAQFPTQVATSIEFQDSLSEPSDNSVCTGDNTALIWTRTGIYRIEENAYRSLYTLFDKRRTRVSPRVTITACGHASPPNSHTGTVELFVASSSIHGDRKLCLTELDSHSPHRYNNLIKFGSSDILFETDITFVQSLTNPAGHRAGLLTRSLSGLLQLWDDRWPRKPVLFYRGSDCGSLYKFASHICPQPVVNLGHALQCVVCPLPASSTVAIWDLWSGNPIRVLEIDPHQNRVPSAPPPLVFLRSSWPSISDDLSRGPGMCVIDRDKMHWFCPT